MRFSRDWRPAFMAAQPKSPEVGDIIAWDFRAFEVTHIAVDVIETEDGGTMRKATFRRLYGPKHPNENSVGDVALQYGTHWRAEVYRDGRIWLCSCCGHPAPCRIAVAEEESARAAREFDERLNRIGPGICYGCGEVITSRQESISFDGEHADFPGRPGPRFHARQKCYSERYEYAARAKRHVDGGELPDPCPGHVTRHGDGTYECTQGAECTSARAWHGSYSSCRCEDVACRQGRRDCHLDGSEVQRCP